MVTLFVVGAVGYVGYRLGAYAATYRKKPVPLRTNELFLQGKM